MGFYLSPGVYTKETDLSDLIPNIATTSAALVGYSPKGDASQIRLITNPNQFIEEYGEPVVGEYFHYSALAYLENGNKLYCLRVHKTALFGGCNIIKASGIGVNAAFLAGVSAADFEDVSSEDVLFQVFGKDQGVWDDKIGIRVTNIDETNYEFDIEVYYQDDDGTYQKKEVWTVSRKTKLDGFGKQEYLESKINDYSAYIRVADNTAEADTVLPGPQAITLALGGGSDGSAITSAELVLGWDEFTNPDDVDVRILINGGETEVPVQTKMKTVAEARKDCIAILDIPYDELTSVASMVTWRTDTQNFNSSYCALYAPWVKIYDKYSDTVIEVPPSGYVSSQIAYSDYVADPWYAPAGFNRGMLNIIGLSNIFTAGERDSLYEGQLNPLQTFRGRGHVIWGQKTQQTRPSALDRVNVRRLLIILEKSIAASLDYFAFEPNNDVTRFRVRATIEEYLETISARGAFQTELGDSGYRVVCDTTNNTPAIIDSNELHVDVYIKPSRAAEFIELNVVITKTGVSFEELIATGAMLQ